MAEKRSAAQIRAEIAAERMALRDGVRALSADTTRAVRAAGSAAAALAGAATLLRLLVRRRRR